jgi:hypothetical protein
MSTRARLATLLVPLAAALAACGTGAAGGGAGGTVVPLASHPAGRQQAARAAAEQLLGKVVLPPGARPSPHEPAGDGGRLDFAPAAPADPNLVDLTRFAVVPGAPAQVGEWLSEHPAAGSTPYGHGTLESPAAPEVWWVAGSWPAAGDVLGTRVLAVSWTGLPGGRSAVRVDAEVTWLPAKPSGDRVPAGSTILTAVLSHGLNPGETGHPLTTTRDRAVIAAIRDKVDGLPVSSPGATSCPADFGQTLTLAFYAHAGATPLAVVVADDGGCGLVRVTEHGRRASQPLSGPDLTRFVEQELGWRVGNAA